VLDPYSGSGTVGRVAAKLDRRFVLIEKEKKYFDYAKKNLSPLVNEKLKIDFNTFK